MYIFYSKNIKQFFGLSCWNRLSANISLSAAEANNCDWQQQQQQQHDRQQQQAVAIADAAYHFGAYLHSALQQVQNISKM